jgi:hypothetical protein
MRNSFQIAACVAPLVVLAIGCDSGGGAQPSMCFGANVTANERNNYAFSSTITLPPVTVAPMSNLTFDWSALTKDFLGHSLNPATDIVMGVLMIWNLPRAEFETALNADALYTADLVVSPPLNLPIAGATSAQLHQFLVNGTAVSEEMFNAYFDATLYPPATTTFLVGVQSGTELGRDIRMLQALELNATSAVTNVALTDTSTKLAYTANLHNLTISGVPGGTAALTLDWSQMTTNALGAEFKEGYVTRAIVGHYAQTPAELETKFLDLDRIAIATYSADIGAGSTLDFTTLRDENGASFPGVDDSGTWLVGLFCGNCRNPAPWYMSILKPCSM